MTRFTETKNTMHYKIILFVLCSLFLLALSFALKAIRLSDYARGAIHGTITFLIVKNLFFNKRV